MNSQAFFSRMKRIHQKEPKREFGFIAQLDREKSPKRKGNDRKNLLYRAKAGIS